MRKRVELVLVTTAIDSAAAAMASETITYSYDVHGRLVRIAHSGSMNNNVAANYTYDSADNRSNVNVTGSP